MHQSKKFKHLELSLAMIIWRAQNYSGQTHQKVPVLFALGHVYDISIPDSFMIPAIGYVPNILGMIPDIYW